LRILHHYLRRQEIDLSLRYVAQSRIGLVGYDWSNLTGQI